MLPFLLTISPADTALILATRILLGSFFSGRITSLFYSLAGGTLCYLIMLLLRRIVSERQIWVCSILGAIAHNIGQITMAILITRTPALICYLPLLMVSGIIAGTFTGLCAQFVVNRGVISEKTL